MKNLYLRNLTTFLNRSLRAVLSPSTLSYWLGLVLWFICLTAHAQTTWTTRTAAADNQWLAVTYGLVSGNPLFVAVAYGGTGNRVMTSPDGVTWTSRTSAADNLWRSVTYGNGLFVAVSSDGTGNRVMTSPDGITWTSRTPAADQSWRAVTYGNGLFVAVADASRFSSTLGNRVMTSPNGINWTLRTTPYDINSGFNNNWDAVTYGNGLFVAVSNDDFGSQVMTSPNGITWTLRTPAADNFWSSVTYGNGLFVAVAYQGDYDKVMTSPNGITWTLRTSAIAAPRSIIYANGLFVAVAASQVQGAMTSPDGINWTLRTAPGNAWYSVAYGNGLFVAVASGGYGDRNLVMTSCATPPTVSITATPSLTISQGQSATLTASGATSYTWSTGQTTAAISVSTATPYSVMGTAAPACSAIASVTVVPCSVSVSIAATPSLTVTQGQSATLTASGATTYKWSTAATTAAISPSTAATYSVTGTTGTCSATASAALSVTPCSVSVSIGATPSLTITQGQSATLTASGATTYKWSTAATTAAISVSTAAIYSVTGTTGTCSPTANVSVTVKPCASLTTTITASPSLTINPGQSTTLTASASTTYKWSTAATTQAIVVAPTSTTAYSVTGVTGACSTTAKVTMTVVPCALTVGIGASPSLTITQGQSATLTASGGTAYKWSTTETTASIVVTPTSATVYSVTGTAGVCSATASSALSVTACTPPTATLNVGGALSCNSPTINIIAGGGTSYTFSTGAAQTGGTTGNTASVTTAGVYSVTVANAAGCTSTASVTVVANKTPPTATFTATSSTFCAGSRVTLTAGGGQHYDFGAGATQNGQNTAFVTTSGSYTAIAYGSNGCTGFASVSVTAIASPTVSIGVSPSLTITQGQSATLTALGATSYVWSTGANTAAISVSTAATYSVTGTTGACSATASAVLSVTAAANPCVFVPQNITVSGFVAAYAAYNGVYAPNGMVNNAPRWLNGSNHTIQWSGTRWEIVGGITPPVPTVYAYNTTGSITNLPCSGWTPVDSEDGTPVLSGGCGPLTLLPVAITPASQTITAGGSATLTASGAASYLWSNGTTANPLIVSNVTSATAFSVTGTTGGCSATASAALSVTVPAVPTIIVSPLTGTATACAGTVSSEMAFTLSGTNLSTESGNSLYLIAPTGFEILSLDGYTDQFGIGIDANGSVLPTTIYVRATSAAPSGSLSGTITITSAGAATQTRAISATVISVTATIVAAGVPGNLTICNGQSTTLTASGGTSFTWSNGSSLSAIVVSPTSTTAYSVTVSSGNCSATATVTVTVNPAVTATIGFSPSQTITAGGSATLTASGAASYLWSNGTTANPLIVSNVTSTTAFSVTGTTGGCSATASAVLSVSAAQVGPLSLTTSSTTSAVCQYSSFTLAVATTGGTAPYSYTWTEPSFTNISATNTPVISATVGISEVKTFTVTVADSSPTPLISTATVSVTVNPTALLVPNGNVSCRTPTVTLTASGGDSYTFSSGATQIGGNTGNTATVTDGGTYNVTVTNSTGCRNTASVYVSSDFSQPATPTLTASSMTFCEGTRVTLTAGGGAYYAFSQGQNGPNSATVTTGGVYSVTAFAGSSGCSAVNSITLTSTAYPALIIAASPSLTIDLGQSATLAASGATSYAWSTSEATPAISVSAAGPYSVTGTTGVCSATASATVITVNSAPVAVPNANQTASLGVPFAYTVNAFTDINTPNSLTYTASFSPANGLTFNPLTRVISGTPVSATVSSVTITATDPGGLSASTVFTIGVGSSQLTVYSRDSDNGQLNTNTLKPYLQLQNDGNTAIPYGELTLRYWLTVENPAPLFFQFGYVQLGADKVHPLYVPISPLRQGATGYIEYRFDGSAGSLAPASNSGQIQNSVLKQDYSYFDQGDDYSYLNTGNFTPNPHITAYRNGILIYGTEPGAVVPVGVSALSLTASASPATLLTTASTVLTAQATGGTPGYSYSFSGPGTITPSGNTASVSGLPAGVQTFTVLVSDASQPSSQTLSTTVSVTVSAPANTPPTTTANTDQTAIVGVGFSYTANAFTDAETPNNLTYSASLNPANGLTVNPVTRVISGTPVSAGVVSVTLTATDPGGLSASTVFTITVSASAVVSTARLVVLQRDPDNGQLNTNTLKPYLVLDNQGTTPIPYGQLTLRYWLTLEDPAPLNFRVNAQLGAQQVHLTYVPVSPLRQGATGYVEVSFDATAGSLAAGTNSGEIQSFINKADYSYFNQGDDYSYMLNRDYAPNAHITAYLGGQLIYGTEPGAGARVGVAETEGALTVRVLGNPAQDGVIAVDVRGAAGERLRLRVTDLNGHLVSEQSVERAGVVEQQRIAVEHTSAGLLLLQVSTPTQTRTVKVLKLN